MSILPTGRREWVICGVLAGLVALIYSILLPANYTQQISWMNWQFLTTQDLAFALVLGLLIAAQVNLQLRAMHRHMPRGGRRLTAMASLLALVPNLLCCTPVVPTLVGLLGLSSVGALPISGPIQGFFSRYQMEFLGGSVLLLVFSITWSLRLIRAAACPTNLRSEVTR